jgi:hypothetical protein
MQVQQSSRIHWYLAEPDCFFRIHAKVIGSPCLRTLGYLARYEDEGVRRLNRMGGDVASSLSSLTIKLPSGTINKFISKSTAISGTKSPERHLTPLSPLHPSKPKMAPLNSPILSAVARRQLQQTTIRRFGARQYTTAKAARAPAEWSSQWKKVGGSAMMYVSRLLLKL